MDEEMDDRLLAIESDIRNILTTVMMIAKKVGVEGFERYDGPEGV